MRAQLAIRFVVEIVAWGAFGFWAFRALHGLMAYVFGIGLTVLAVGLWGLLAAPKSAMHVRPRTKELLAISVFLLATVAIAAGGEPLFAAVFIAIALVNSLQLWLHGVRG
jgi:hypothetical protein